MKGYITRQQIRAINKKLYAYDLIYKSDAEEQGNTVEYLLTNIILNDNATDDISDIPMVIEVGTNSIRKNLDNILLINKDAIIIEISNEMLNKAECMNEISVLKNKGYKFIVRVEKEDKSILRATIIADIIKVDIHDIPDIITQKIGTLRCKLMAYKVDDRDAYIKAEDLSMDFYEGTYIADSSNIDIEDNSHSKVNFMEVMSLLNKENADINKIADVIKRDALLSSQLVKLSNSAYFSGRAKTDDVKSAVVRIGMVNLRRWMFLLNFSNNKDVPEELLQCSYLRALLSEEVAKKSSVSKINPNSAYTIGLFSILNILTGKTMENAICNMELDSEIADALIYREGDGGQLLNLITAYEEANWDRVDKYISKLNLNKDEMFKMYFESLSEVENLWKELESMQQTEEQG